MNMENILIMVNGIITIIEVIKSIMNTIVSFLIYQNIVLIL